MPSTPTTSLKLDAEMKARVQRVAAAQRRTSHWIMREAIDEYVSRQEKRQSFLKNAQTAWEEYQRTGLHLTGDEVNAWLDKLSSGEDSALPPCHI